MNCPKCGATLEDWKPLKASGKVKPNAPDMKCPDKTCGYALWPPKNAAPLAATVAKVVDRVAPGLSSFTERPPALGDTDTQLIFLWEDCTRRAAKLCDTMNNEVGGPVLDGVQVVSLTITLFIGRSRLLTGKG